LSATDLALDARTPATREGRRRQAILDKTPGAWLADVVKIVIAVFFVLFFVIPIVWLLLASTKSPHDLITTGPFTAGTFSDLSANWHELVTFQDGIVFRWLGNSAYYSVAALVITLVTTIPAGYALALSSFRGRQLLLTTTLVVMLIPNTALVLPIFLELSAVGLIGKPLAAILPFSFFPFGVYLTYIYFSTSVPRDLLDAARIDGCGELAVFLRVAMPLATPVIALVGFFSFVANWNNFFLPFLTVPGPRSPIQVGLTDLLSNVPSFNPTSAGVTAIQLPTLAVATVLSVLPVLLIFLFSQRFLVAGLTAGGTKE